MHRRHVFKITNCLGWGQNNDDCVFVNACLLIPPHPLKYSHVHTSDFQNLFLMGFVFMNIGDNGWGMCSLNTHSTPISTSGSHRYAKHEGLTARFAAIN